MPKLNMTKDEFYDVEDTWIDISGEIVDQRRWTTTFEYIVKRPTDNTVWRYYMDRGSTESQDFDYFDYNKTIELEQVEEKEVVVKRWVAVDD